MIGIRDWIGQKLFEPDNMQKSGFWEGTAMKTGWWGALLYAIVAVGAPVVFAVSGVNPLKLLNVAELMNPARWQLALAVFTATIVSAGPPAFFWFEAKAFNVWLNRKFHDAEDEEQKQSRELWKETYKLNVENGKDFWKAVLAVYAGIIYLGK
jgi:hypothetical protein